MVTIDGKNKSKVDMTVPKEIVFTVVISQKEKKITTYAREYNSLMELIFDKLYLEDFGECKGIGRCGTCMVRINYNTLNGNTDLERNEETTLLKMGVSDSTVRLSCQVLIEERLSNSFIYVV